MRSAVIGEATDFTFETVGDFAADNTMADGSPGKIALHAVAGGAIAEVTGGDFASGAIAAGITEALSPAIDNLAAKETRTKVAGLTGALSSFALGSDAGIISANAAITESARANNRELHPKERQVLMAAMKGKTPEQQQRLLAAFVRGIKAIEGLEPSDPRFAEVNALYGKDENYSGEYQELVQTAAEFGYDIFKYDSWDAVNDYLSSHGEIVERATGAAKIASGAVGEAGSLVAIGTPGVNLLTGALGVASLYGSHEYVQSGMEQLTGEYVPTEGSAVLESVLGGPRVSDSSYLEERALSLAVDTAIGIGAGRVLHGAVSGLQAAQALAAPTLSKAAARMSSATGAKVSAGASGGTSLEVNKEVQR